MKSRYTTLPLLHDSEGNESIPYKKEARALTHTHGHAHIYTGNAGEAVNTIYIYTCIYICMLMPTTLSDWQNSYALWDTYVCVVIGEVKEIPKAVTERKL